MKCEASDCIRANVVGWLAFSVFALAVTALWLLLFERKKRIDAFRPILFLLVALQSLLLFTKNLLVRTAMVYFVVDYIQVLLYTSLAFFFVRLSIRLAGVKTLWPLTVVAITVVIIYSTSVLLYSCVIAINTTITCADLSWILSSASAFAIAGIFLLASIYIVCQLRGRDVGGSSDLARKSRRSKRRQLLFLIVFDAFCALVKLVYDLYTRVEFINNGNKCTDLENVGWGVFLVILIRLCIRLAPAAAALYVFFISAYLPVVFRCWTCCTRAEGGDGGFGDTSGASFTSRGSIYRQMRRTSTTRRLLSAAEMSAPAVPLATASMITADSTSGFSESLTAKHASATIAPLGPTVLAMSPHNENGNVPPPPPATWESQSSSPPAPR